MRIIKSGGFIFFLIFILAVFLRFYNLGNIDIENDASLNAFRAMQWFDFLGFEGQSSPIIWFGHIPWWANLSFHDMPPLSMAFSYVSIYFFGTNNFGVLLPYIFSSLAVVFFLYFFLRRIKSQKEALLASFIFAVSSYSIWISRTAYLEGIEILFIILTFFFFIYFLNFRQKKYLYFCAISLALSILTKYTAIFLLPAMISYWLIWQKSIFKYKHWWISALIFVLILSPIIIYNFFVFKTRGHFDAAFSSMLGMHPEDFAVIAQRGANTNILQNVGSFLVVLYRSSSLPLFAIYYSSLIYLLIRVVKRKASHFEYFLGLNIFFMLTMFSFSGAPVRLLSIITPFLAISASIFIFWLIGIIGENRKKIIYLVLFLFAIFELFYSVNTNILIKPLGTGSWVYSPYRFYNLGFNQMEKYLREEVMKGEIKSKRPENISQIRDITLSKNYVVLFDERLDWFSSFWYVFPYIFYYKEPVFLFSNLEASMIQSGHQNFVNFFSELGIDEYWFVYVTEKGIRSKKSDNYSEQMEAIKNDLEKAGIFPAKEIRDFKGDVVFKIYHFYHIQ